MKFEGAIFDLDGTLTDSMYIWNEAPKALVRQFGGQPPEDLAEDIKEMGRREASEYMVARFSLPCTPEQVMDGVNDLVTDEYRDRVPMKPGADVLLDRLAVLGVPCGIATASEAFQARGPLRHRHRQRGLPGPGRHGPPGAVEALPVRLQLSPVRLQEQTGRVFCRRTEPRLRAGTHHRL